jgi:hypothetical protein
MNAIKHVNQPIEGKSTQPAFQPSSRSFPAKILYVYLVRYLGSVDISSQPNES